MAKKENTIPTIIDTPEALTAKIAAHERGTEDFRNIYPGAGR